MKIDRERLWCNLMKLGNVGRTEQGGVTRLSFTKQEKEAKEFLIKLMNQTNLEIHEDAMGNLYGRKEGIYKNEPVVLIGSHIDTVINGGIFDGAAGVLAGIEIVQTLNDQGITTKYPIEIVAFTDEEGTRFSSGMLGSRAVVGDLTLQELKQNSDHSGKTIAMVMKENGYNEKLIKNAKRSASEIKAYLELHIEQGKVLENEDIPVGIVSGIAGLTWLKVSLKGELGHAGTTPMPLRKDPLAAMAKIITYCEEVALQQHHTVITAGNILVNHGGINVIANDVKVIFDIRDLSGENLQLIEKLIRMYIDKLCVERNIQYDIEILEHHEPSLCSSYINHNLEIACNKLNIKPKYLMSGAAHDAMVMSKITDIGMILVRTKEGVSHHPSEWASKEDIAIGTELLYNTILQLE
ncbi:M20 family metallo-hydrolase [Peribacillus sp. NPDC096540]|uniref:M20 family metallo-hydrolase n=1 Tax=Peribacillus sp. NPDC096540 TaxID=3390612 RepID=UPI003D0020D2